MALIPTKKIDNFKNQTIDTITDNVKFLMLLIV